MRRFVIIISIFAIVIFASYGYKFSSIPLSDDPKIARLKLPQGFRAERLYGPSENGEGSWVSMTFDHKGRLIASDQWGALYRMVLPAIGDTISKLQIERLLIPDSTGKIDTSTSRISIGYAHGLLYAFNSLYVVINHRGDKSFAKSSGLYRLQDLDGDDQFDKVTLLKALKGEGEHGPHSIKLSPDKKSLFLIAGNFTAIPEMQSYRVSSDAKLDNLLPYVKDPRGHDNTVALHGGWIANLDSTGTNWELFSAGYRNPFDFAFNDAGDMFTYDSDMEWDLGTPWYRPTRIVHATSGSEFGWRPGTEKWSPAFADNQPALLNIGQGSPTNVVYGGDARFPEKYRKAIFAFDWSFGIIYAIHLKPSGASYTATGEEFASGSPLPLTDGIIGPDGAMYVLTGGRRLESDLYRIYYGNGQTELTALTATVLNEEHQIRRKLEDFHIGAVPGAVDETWPRLNHPDRHIRYAARVALEHQPLNQWKDRFYKENNPVTLIQSMMAMARVAPIGERDSILSVISRIDYSRLQQQQQFDLLRSIELVISRMGKPGNGTTTSLIRYLDSHYPSTRGNEINRQLSKILIHLNAPGSVKKTMQLLTKATDKPSSQEETFTKSADLIMRNPQYGGDIANTLSNVPPQQQTFLATVLSQANEGWTEELHDQYFKWFNKAFSYGGGYSFSGFINSIRKNALTHVEKPKFDHYNKISGDSIADKPLTHLMAGAIAPKGPGRNWKVADALRYVDSGMSNRNFERGKGLFTAMICLSCHVMNGQGGAAGPDLTQVGNRFTYQNMLEAIIEPSKTISDQYGTTEFRLKGGSSVVGRLVSENKDKYFISQNPFVPQQLRAIDKKQVISKRLSELSAMPGGLINGLNPEELKDLLAFLKAGGKSQDTIFSR